MPAMLGNFEVEVSPQHVVTRRMIVGSTYVATLRSCPWRDYDGSDLEESSKR